MNTVQYYGTDRSFHELPIKFKLNRRLDRWEVRRADNNRSLGWVGRPHQYETKTIPNSGWTAHVDSSAFRGDSADNLGNFLDEVPGWLHNGGDHGYTSRSITEANTRQEAAEALVDFLARKEAPALGYGRNPWVKRWEDR